MLDRAQPVQFEQSEPRQFRTVNMNAVEVRGGYKYYGKDKDPKIILNRLDMNVSHGSM